MPLKHLLKQVEIYRNKRKNRDLRPEWVLQLIDEVADLFEPLDEIGRVGYDCQLSEECWNIGMYMGSTEHMGGPQDGLSQNSNFDFNLNALMAKFTELHRLCWSATPDNNHSDGQQSCSMITLEGTVQNEQVRLQLYSIPPQEAGPGFRCYADGHFEEA